MGDPRGHSKSLANATEFMKGPITLNLPGECESVTIVYFNASGLYLVHHVCAAEIQKSWLDV